MMRSTDRILTTHVGSLPRPADLLAMLRARERGEAQDAHAFASRVRGAVSDVVRKQLDLGVDIVDDGEMGKPGFIHYANDRLAGFEPLGEAVGSPWKNSREVKAFPEFYEWFGRVLPSPAATAGHMVCTGPISYKGQALVQADIANLKAALGSRKVEDVFMPAISPTSVEDWQRNRYYRTQEEFLFAIAGAMREEYKAIVDAGLILQIDDAFLPYMYEKLVPPMTLPEYRKWAELRIEALNHALDGIPPERTRYHICWGSWNGPHTFDVPLKDIVDLVLKVRVGGYMIEAANPRHEHEWRVWEKVKLAPGKTLIPGVISHATNIVEHPELVAERIVRIARLVGRESVLGGTDCGFAQSPFARRVHPTIMWAKLRALAEGAKLATAELWGRGSAA
jgi:5-methyltetrahydropteroyltriglutamate--homocysteine methyltransferase